MSDAIDDVLSQALAQSLIDDKQRWAIFFDLDELDDRYARLEHAFPADVIHAVAIKANPLGACLKHLVDSGTGLEAASWGEVELALAAGCPPQRIVFDSPAKTISELRRALDAGIYINADNLSELERIDALRPPDDARVGIRINPVVGAGAIDATSVATASSKFGVSLVRQQRALLEAFENYPWLRGLHVHTGSQGLGLDLLVEGVRRCADFAAKLDRKFGAPRIDTVDIGGGLSVAYRPHEQAPSIEDYAGALRQKVPELFDRRWQVITEFGRWLHGPCAFAASHVEYVKESPSGTIATIHFGADLLLRRAYRPDQWFQKLTVHDPSGRLRTADETELTIAGPLCFAGDVLTDFERIPRPSPGDLIVAHDVGAYTFAMWSRYCSRPFPRIYGFRHHSGHARFEVLHDGEDERDLIDFWGS